MFTISRYLGPTPDRQIPISPPPPYVAPGPPRKSKSEKRRCKSVPLLLDHFRFQRAQSEPRQPPPRQWDKRFLSRVQKSVDDHKVLRDDHRVLRDDHRVLQDDHRVRREDHRAFRDDPKVSRVMSFENLSRGDTRGLLHSHILPVSRDVSLFVEAPMETNVTASRQQRRNSASMRLQLRPSVPQPPPTSHRSTVVVSCLRHDPRPTNDIPSVPKRRASTHVMGVRPTQAHTASSSITVMKVEPDRHNGVNKTERSVAVPSRAHESFVAAVAEFGRSYDVYSRRFSEPMRRRKRLTFACDQKLVTTYEYSPENTMTGHVSLSNLPGPTSIEACWL